MMIEIKKMKSNDTWLKLKVNDNINISDNTRKPNLHIDQMTQPTRFKTVKIDTKEAYLKRIFNFFGGKPFKLVLQLEGMFVINC